MATAIVPLFGIPVGMELIVLVIIFVILFGSRKIPEIARSTGEALGQFQRGKEEAFEPNNSETKPGSESAIKLEGEPVTGEPDEET